MPDALSTEAGGDRLANLPSGYFFALTAAWAAASRAMGTRYGEQLT